MIKNSSPKKEWLRISNQTKIEVDRKINYLDYFNFASNQGKWHHGLAQLNHYFQNIITHLALIVSVKEK